MSQTGDLSDSTEEAPRRAPSPARPPGRPRRSRRRRILGWAAVVVAVAFVAGSLAVYVRYRDVWDSIRRVAITGLGRRPPQYSTSAENILLIGSDSRSGQNRQFGASVQGQRSDTIMVVHLSPGRHAVTVLSIPRDSVVPVLPCPASDAASGQAAQPGQVEQINGTFAAGGPGCLWKTIEQTTGIRLDHFIELDFTGFEKVINDIGGVSICLPYPISDPRSKLDLSAGRHHVLGAEALAFWRARYIGEGSDLQRIQRDQYLMAALLQGVRRSGLLGSPAELNSVAGDAARSMTTDSGLDLFSMIRIVDSLRGLPAGAVHFIELPTVAYPPNPNWVQWPAPDTALFAALARDRVLPHTSNSAPPQSAAPSGATAAPAPSTSAGPGDLTRKYGGISGNANVCDDQTAFSGPDGGS